MKNSKKFQPGDKIFAKVKGFVYWPARVNPLPPDVKIPSNKIPIFFYGTHEVYFISPSSCWVYDEKTKSKWGKPKPRAHFNQGMDEIENNPTIYQFGEDPTAEEFLTQFYEFIKSNGEYNLVSKGEERVRHKSSGSNSTNISKKAESNSKSEKINNRKRKVEDDIAEDEEADDDKDEEMESGSESPSVASDNSQDEDFKPLTKKARLSRTKKSEKVKPNRRSSVKRENKLTKSDNGKNVENEQNKADENDSQSDNKNNADFECENSVSVECSNKKLGEKKPKRQASVKKAKTNAKGKKQNSTKRLPKVKPIIKKCDDDLDSLSSISSIEDWKAKDEKEKKDMEEITRKKQLEQLKKEEEVIKVTRERRKIEQEKSENEILEQKSDDDANDAIKKESFEITDGDLKKEVNDTVCDKEIVVQLTKTDFSEKQEVEEIDANDNKQILDNNDVEMMESTELIEPIAKENEIVNIDNKEAVDINEEENTKTIANDKETISKFQENKNDIKSVKNSKSGWLGDSEDSVEEEVIQKKKSESKKKSKRKFSEVPKKNNTKKRVVKLSDSEDEIEMEKPKNKKIEKETICTDENDNKRKENEPKQLELLQMYTSDIRSSLVFNNEDYDKCLNCFKSLMVMDIEIMNLIRCWTLVETVKKCRKYKKNDKIKIEAQNVYNRFMEIYSKANTEEIKMAQLLLSEYKNPKKEDKKGQTPPSTGQDLPLSIDDMFISGQPTEELSNKSEKNMKDELPQEKSNELTNNEETEEDKLKHLNEELEAKANAILFKIEKNATINEKSLSHLLPVSNKNTITLPTEWQSAKDSKREKKVIDKDSDDEDDEEIFRRIEEVPIKQTEIEEAENIIPSPPKLQPQAITSSLDARIASLMNDSMSSVKSDKYKKSKNYKSSRNSYRAEKQKTPIPLSPKSSESRLSLEPAYKQIPMPLEIKAPVPTQISEAATEKSIIPTEKPPVQKDDNEIYDLLGV